MKTGTLLLLTLLWANTATAEVREDFRDTILWLPTLETDEDGLLTTEVTFPDNLTEWRMTARVISQEDQVGQNQFYQACLPRDIVRCELKIKDNMIYIILLIKWKMICLNYQLKTLKKYNI